MKIIALIEPVPSFLFSRLLCFRLRCFFWETSGDELVVWPPELNPSSDVDSIWPFSVIELILSDRWYFWIMVKIGSYASPKVCFCSVGGASNYEVSKTKLWSKLQILENFKVQSDQSKIISGFKINEIQNSNEASESKLRTCPSKIDVKALGPCGSPKNFIWSSFEFILGKVHQKWWF